MRDGEEQEQFLRMKRVVRELPSTVTSDGRTSNMDWMTGRVWVGSGLKARKEVQSRVASVQFSGVGYEWVVWEIDSNGRRIRRVCRRRGDDCTNFIVE